MAILTGLLYINNVDVYAQYGAFLAEKEGGGHENYDSLFKPAKTKEQVAIDIREQNGEMLPATLNVQFEARDITLYFAIVGATSAQFLARRAAFKEFLRSGNNGWLDLRLTEIAYTFRLYLKDFGGWEQLNFGGGQCAARFPVTFREPNPTF
jgi:hypothetical protein